MQHKDLHLSDLVSGEDGIITKVLGHGSFRKRITEMGFVKGKKVTVVKNAPLQDPIEYKVMGYNVSLRRSEADLIEIVAPTNWTAEELREFNVKDSDEILLSTANEHTKVINVALVGNPNSGKTTLYNYASGSHEKVGNYGGVTVDARQAKLKKNGYTFNIVDLPGTYSISEYTPEELYVRNHIIENTPDIVINVIDASNLERNMFLTTQLIDMNIKVIVALNMYDELERTGAKFDYETLGKMLGIPFVPTTASKGIGIDAVFERAIEVYEDKDPIVRHIHINYGEGLEESVERVKLLIKENPAITDKYCARDIALKLVGGDKTTFERLQICPNFNAIKKQTEQEISHLEHLYKEKPETLISDAKYGFIAGALSETFKAGPVDNFKQSTAIDKVLTNRFFGFPLFLIFMWITFQLTFSIGQIPMDWIDGGIEILSNFVSANMADGMFKDLLVDGIIGGVGGVIVFLPNIMILFFCLSFMEDTGYMARASFIMDKLMHKIGLHGKSFIPLVAGFGCGVPAIMASRTIGNRRDRILTVMMIPFVSCSARLPVYVLLISAFFPIYQGLVLISIYIIGIIVSVISVTIIQRFIVKDDTAPFVMELPPYRIPTLRNTSIHMWHKAKQYLQKMGGIILIASIAMWLLSYFPQNDEEPNVQIEQSYIGQLGQLIEPVIAPLGFDWKIGVSIIAGLGAKEIVVSTMGVLYQSEVEDDDTANLQVKLQEQTYVTGKHKGEKVFTPLVAFCLMLFVLLYFPCIAALAAIKREIGIKWAIFTAFYTTAIAWVVSLVVYQIGILF